MKIDLEPDSFGATVSAEFVEGLRDDETSSSKHSPSCMNQFKCLVSACQKHKKHHFFTKPSYNNWTNYSSFCRLIKIYLLGEVFGLLAESKGVITIAVTNQIKQCVRVQFPLEPKHRTTMMRRIKKNWTVLAGDFSVQVLGDLGSVQQTIWQENPSIRP